MAKKNNRKRSTGWAKTKWYPHKKHPAFYKREGQDDIEYVTFTHSKKVTFPSGESIDTVDLDYNIDYSNKGDHRYSHVVPRVYKGKRSALGKDTNEYRLEKSDRDKVDKIFTTGKRYPVPHTGNSIKKKPRW